MTDRDPNPLIEAKFKYIEDIIDSRKLLGHYAVQHAGRYAYSQPSRTDSEITVVRVAALERDGRDAAAPGDGSHLGDSPSLVNLATLVGDAVPFEGEERLVPLSSWEPACEGPAMAKGKRNSGGRAAEDGSAAAKGLDEEGWIARKPSWAGKISNFIRKLKN